MENTWPYFQVFGRLSRAARPAVVTPVCLARVVSSGDNCRMDPAAGLDARHAWISAANRLLFAGLPLRDPDSRIELARFLQAARLPLPAGERHAILIEILAVMNPHSGRRLPSLADRYLLKSAGRIGQIDVFAECVTEVIGYRGIGHPAVQRAVSLMEAHFANSGLTLARLADMVGLKAAVLSDRFRSCTSLTPGEYLRNLRLDRAAARLTTTGDRIKEVWVSVGYNDAANFGHDFRHKFGVSPRAYRAMTSSDQSQSHINQGVRGSQAGDGRGAGLVLLVDDDAVLRDITRRLLERAGFVVLTASDGASGLAEASRHPVDVLLLDYRLPDLDGIQFLRALRAQRPGRKPAVAVFTADWTVEDHAAEIVSLNAGILSKLCDFDTVEHMVKSYCGLPLNAA